MSERLLPGCNVPIRPSRLGAGGTGAVGRAVLHELSARGITTVFTYHTSTDRAAEAIESYGFPGLSSVSPMPPRPRAVCWS